jgi:inorganic triphosphatase YgiF
MRAEIEAKFLADDLAVLEALATTPDLAFAALAPARTVPESDRYLDTIDGELAARRWACRLRRREGAFRVSLKGPTETTIGSWHHRRPEIEGPATDSLEPADWPDSEARQWLLELAGGNPLVERFELRQDRTERSVVVDGQPIGTMSLDVVDVIDRERERGRLNVVELELAGEDSVSADGFRILAEALAALPGLRPDPRTKLEHALELIADR